MPFLTPPERAQLDRLLRPRLGLGVWGRRFLPNHFGRPASPLHHWLADTLQGLHRRRGTRLAVIAPRGNAKTTWISLAYPLYAALNNLEPYTWLLSDSADQAVQNLTTIKQELEGNELLAGVYPRTAGPGPVWRANRIELRNGCVIEAHGTGSRVRGRKTRRSRPSLVIGDDLESEEHATSATLRDRSWRWFTRSVLNAGNPETNFLCAGTTLHRESLISRLQRQPGWQARLFKSVIRWPARMDLWAQWEGLLSDWENSDRDAAARAYFERNRPAMEEGAEVLWPAMESLYHLMQLRVTIGHAAFAAEKQGDPFDPSRSEFPESYFGGPGFWFEAWPQNLDVKVLSLDPSKGKDSDIGDYSALVKLGYDQRGVGYNQRGVVYVEADLQRRPTPQIVAEGVEMARQFRPDAFAVEVNQYQELLCVELGREAANRQVPLPVVPVENTVNKQVRIRRLGPYLSQRQFRFKARSPGTILLVEQLKDFPNGDHDDGPDALEQGLRILIDLYNGRQRPTAPRRLKV
jgi:predicted phage terminase large subunit-like protein